MSGIFLRAINSASFLEFDARSNNIVYRTRMYDSKIGGYTMREVTIDEEEWDAIIKYGEEAGFQR